MAQIQADEIARLLRGEIEHYDKAVSVSETGSVISVGDGIARVYGLENVMSGEMVEFPHGVTGIALNLEEDQVGTVLLVNTRRSRKATRSAVRVRSWPCRWARP